MYVYVLVRSCFSAAAHPSAIYDNDFNKCLLSYLHPFRGVAVTANTYVTRNSFYFHTTQVSNIWHWPAWSNPAMWWIPPLGQRTSFSFFLNFSGWLGNAMRVEGTIVRTNVRKSGGHACSYARTHVRTRVRISSLFRPVSILNAFYTSWLLSTGI